jgi:hypothetical protein
LTPNISNSNSSELLTERGILVSEEATTTILNNIVANNFNGIVQVPNQPGSPGSMVVGANAFQHNQGSNSGLGSDNIDFNFVLGNNEPLFVNPADGDLYPARLTRAIDSAVDSLEDRPVFIQVKAAMGIANSPILAPETDATGQLRQDDPEVSTPQGQGSNVFKDRGSLDRSDFIGPTAILILPRDNDSLGRDIDPATTVVHLTEGTYSSFQIQLVDGFEIFDPFPGVGIHDESVDGPTGPEGQMPGSVVTVFENGRFLQEGIDYTFRYDTTSNVIRLTPTAGVWASDKVYRIQLNNRSRFVLNAPSGDQVVQMPLDERQFFITDGAGTTVTFQYDTGFYFDIPQSLAIQVPLAGVTDGQRFQIRDATDVLNVPVTFEFVFNNRMPDDGNQAVPIAADSSSDEIARAIIDALDLVDGLLDGVFPWGLQPQLGDDGMVYLGATAPVTVNTDLSSLTVPPTVLTFTIPVIDLGGLTIPDLSDGDTFSVSVSGGPPATFEFDTDNSWPLGDFQIDISFAGTVDEVGQAIVDALLGSGLNLTGVQNAGDGLVYVNVGGAAVLDPMTTDAFVGFSARPLQDGERFTVLYDHDDDPATPSIQRVFEFSSDGLPQPDTDVVIPFSPSEPESDIAQRTALAVRREPELGMPEAKHLSGGRVYLGGTLLHDVDLTEAPTISPTGQPLDRPQVQTSTQLNLPGYFSVELPAGGGGVLIEQDFFTIIDGSAPPGQQAVRFEFDSDDVYDIGFPSFPVSYLSASPDELADNIIAAINGAKDFLIDIGFLAAVTPNKVVLPDGQIVVELTGANGFHSLDTSTATNVNQRGGRIGDSTFVIAYEGTSVTFEFDSDDLLSNPANTRIRYTQSTSLDEIASRVESAIEGVPALNLPGVQYLGNGVLALNDTPRHQRSVGFSPLPPNNQMTFTGIPGGAVRLAFEPWDQFTGEQFARDIVSAINANGAFTGVLATVRGGNTFFVDFRDANGDPVDYFGGTAAVRDISNYFLLAIQDEPGNWLKANQASDESLFTILMPVAQLDFGDAFSGSGLSQYPTRFDQDGARHVIAGGLFLGSRVDADPDGQIVPPGLGDDLDVRFLVDNPRLQLTGTVPYTVQLPSVQTLDGRTIEITDATAFPVRTVVFEFDQDGNGVAGTHRAVVYPAGASVSAVGQALASAVAEAFANLNPMHLEGGAVHVGGRALHQIDVSGSPLTSEGNPVFLLRAVPAMAILDGDTILVNDGRFTAGRQYPVPVRFEFDVDGRVAVGNHPVDISAAVTASDVASALKLAIESAGVQLDLNDLGDGTLHVTGTPSHLIELGASGVTFADYAPLRLQAPGAALGFRITPELKIQVANVIGGGVADGDQFSISDGYTTVRFEFDTEVPAKLNDPNAIRIPVTALQSQSLVAAAIYNAIFNQTDLATPPGPLTGLNPVPPNGSLEVDLGAGVLHRLDTSMSGLGQTIAVADGATLTVGDGTNQVTFEFDFDEPASLVDGSRRRIPVSVADSANDLANKIVLAVSGAISADATPAANELSNEAGLSPKNLGRGDIQIGGDSSQADLLSSAPLIRKMGAPGGVLDGDTFSTILQGFAATRFEFDANGQATPGNATIAYDLASTADDIAEAIVQHVRAAQFPSSIVHLGGGEIRIEGDDEDGVLFTRPFTANAQVPVIVTASDTGYLSAWVDFNGDGDWDDPGEQVFTNVLLSAGVNRDRPDLVIHVPAVTITGSTAARFRFSSMLDLAPTGLAIDGEVEDYTIEIIANQAPVLTAPVTLTADEDTDRFITGVSIQDPDAFTTTIEVRLEAIHGNITVVPGIVGGLTFAQINPFGPDPDCNPAMPGVCTVIVRGTLAQINTTFASPTGLRYRGNLDFNGDDLLTIVVDDLAPASSGGPQQDYRTIPVTVLPVNDPPRVLFSPDPLPTQQVDEDQVLTFPAGAIQISDVDYEPNGLAASTLIQVTLQVANGVLQVKNDVTGGVGTDNITPLDGGRTMVLLATLDQINATLADADGLRYVPDPDFDQDDALVITVNDLGNFGAGGPLEGTGTVAIDIRALNDDPVVTVPTALTTLENTPLGMVGFDVSDVDAGAAIITVTLRIDSRSDGGSQNGTITVHPVSGGVDPTNVNQVQNDGTSEVTLTATVAQISATISNPAGWTYTPPADFGGTPAEPRTDMLTEVLTIVANDGGATGDPNPPGDGTDMRSVTITVQAVNDAPVVDVSSVVLNPAVPLEDNPVQIRDINVSDRDAGNEPIQVTLTVINGTINVPASSEVDMLGNNSASVTLLGSQTQINLLLAQGVTYDPSLDFSGVETVVITADDLGNWPPPPAVGTASFSFTVWAVNDPPEIHLPSDQPFQVNEDEAKTIASLSVTDVDAGDAEIDVWLSVTHGQLTIANPGGVTITPTGPAEDLVLSGPVAAINAALATLTYQGNLNYNGLDTLVITANDRGNSPVTADPVEDVTAQLAIEVLAVNDAPTITFAPDFPNPLMATEDIALPIHYGITVDDVDLDEAGGTGEMTVHLQVQHGVLTVVEGVVGAQIETNGTAHVMITGSLAAINATLHDGGVGFIYQGNLDFNGADVLTVIADDLGNYPGTPDPDLALRTTATRPIQVAAVNDSPVFTSFPAAPVEIDEGAEAQAVVTSIQIADVDAADSMPGHLQVTLSIPANSGTILVMPSVASPVAGVPADRITGNGTWLITLTGTVDEINATLAAGVTYTVPHEDYNNAIHGGDVLMTVTVNDQGNTGDNPDGTPNDGEDVTGTVTVTIHPVNDPPEFAADGNVIVNEDAGPRTFAGWASRIAPGPEDATDEENQQLTLTVGVASMTPFMAFTTPPAVDPVSGDLTFEVAPNANGTATVTVDLKDDGPGDAPHQNAAPTYTFTISVIAINDPPTLVAPAGVEADEDEIFALPYSEQDGFFVQDIDAIEGNGNVRITFEVQTGTIRVNTNVANGVGVANVVGNNTRLVTITATPGQINATLEADGIGYLGAPNFPYNQPTGTDRLVVRLTDSINGVINHGIGGTVDALATVTVTVKQVNDAPVLTVQIPASFAEDTPAPVTITLTDVEMGSGAMFDALLTSQHGFFTVMNAAPGVVIEDNGTGNVILSGTDQQIKTTLEAINGVTFQGNQDFNGPASLTVTIVDRGLQPESPDNVETVVQPANFVITAVNDAPVIQAPASRQVAEDQDLALGSSTIRVTDVDSGQNEIEVTLEVGKGIITVKTDVAGGLAAANISNNQTGQVILRGTVEAIGKTLDDSGGLRYRPNLNYFGSDLLTVTADDRGHSGAGGAKVVTASISISVTSVNDPPIVANPIGRVNAIEDAPNRFIQLFPGVFDDVDDNVLTLTVTANSNSSLVAAEIVRSDAPDGPPCPPATDPNPLCTLLRLTFLPNQSGEATISVRAFDGEFSATDTFTVNVTPVPDPPFVANPLADLVVSVPEVTPPLGTATRTVNLTGVFDDPDIPFGDTLTLAYNNATDNTNQSVVIGSLVGQTLNLTFSGAAGRTVLTVHAIDSTGNRVSDSFAVTVNAPPVARNDAATTRMNTPVNILVTANDTDADGTIDQGSITIVPGSEPLNGTVDVANGLVTYTPDANYWNRNHPRELGWPLETFRYTVRDNQGFVSNEATVSITVTWVAVFQNPFLQPDVNASGHVSPIDALALINYLNTNPSGVLPDPPIPPDPREVKS